MNWISTRKPAAATGIRRFVAMALAVTAVSWGDGASAADDAAMKALIEAAKKEGEVVVYSAESDLQVAETSKDFEKRYGIKVQGIRLVSGTISTRYAGERKGGTVVADVVVISNDPFVTDNPSWWVPLSESVIPGYDRYPASVREKLLVTLGHNIIGIAWNSSLVKPENEPKSYLDIVENPAFANRGDILYADPRATPSAMNLFKVLLEKYGEDFFKKLRERGVAIAPGSSPGVQQIAAGANKVMIGNFPNNAQSIIAAGGPVKYTGVTDPSTGVDNRLALSAGARNPNAARLYAAYRMSEEGQRVMCSAKGSTSPLGQFPGCEPAAPPNYIKTDFSVFADKAWQAKHLPLLGLKPN